MRMMMMMMIWPRVVTNESLKDLYFQPFKGHARKKKLFLRRERRIFKSRDYYQLL